jgi:hypothetical protein
MQDTSGITIAAWTSRGDAPVARWPCIDRANERTTRVHPRADATTIDYVGNLIHVPGGVGTEGMCSMQDARISTAGWMCFLAMTAMCAGSGGGGHTGSETPLPRRNDPAFGNVGNALISDRVDDIDGVHDEVWIGVNRQQDWDGFVALNQGMLPSGSFWIGGHLIADPHHHLGFYCDPNTTNAAEETIEIIQTSIDGLKRDLQFVAENQWQRWVIPAEVEKSVPTAD